MDSTPNWIPEYITNIGTPHFVVDLKIVKDQINLFKKLFPETIPYYSTKTNSSLPIIECCRNEGLHFDVATIFEIEMLTKQGVPSENMLFTHPVKTEDEIHTAFALGVNKFTVDSLSELIKVSNEVPESNIFVRFSTPKSTSLYNYQDRLGASESELKVILDYAAQRNLRIRGISFHVGSQSMNLASWEPALKLCREIIKEYYQLLPDLRFVNLGSGFPVDYGFGDPPSLVDIAKYLSSEISKFPSDIKFMAEPGRIIVAPAGILFSKIVDVIRRTKTKWIFTDATVYSGLIERIESGGRFEYSVFSSGDHNGTSVYSVAGKTLDPDDIIASNISLDSSLKAGDIIGINHCGAYTLEFFTHYHSLPKPHVTFYDTTYADRVKISTSKVAGRGLLAVRDIKKGEHIFTVTGYPSQSRTRTSFQIGSDAHLEPLLFGAYLNHSCEPNAGIRTNAGWLLDVIAKQDISMDEEIAVDYAMFEYELSDMAKHKCLCGSKKCRQKITGYKDIPDEKKKDYEGYIADHLI